MVPADGTVTLTGNGWVAWHPEPRRESRPLPPEWVFRELLAGDLGDPTWLMAVVNQRGMVWGSTRRLRDDDVTPSEAGDAPLPPVDSPLAVTHLTVVRNHLAALAVAAAEWLDRDATGAEVTAAFWRVLDAGTARFTPPRVARSERLDGDLFEAGCWQLFAATVDRVGVKRCRNTGCGRLFYRQDGAARYGQRHSTGVYYCSASCRWSQNKRDYRRRLALTGSQGLP